jgi:hypothetical protein
MSLRRARQGVLTRLRHVRQRIRAQLTVEGLFWTITAAGLAAVASLLLDLTFRFSLPTRFALLGLASAGIAAVVVRQLVRPLLVPLGDLDLAGLLDRRLPGVGQQISNVLQLPELIQSEPLASPSMVSAAVAECAQALDRVDLLSTLNTPRLGKLLAGSAAWIVLFAAIWAIWPATMSLWARRWLAAADVRWPQNTYLEVIGLNREGKLLVPRGEPSILKINARPTFRAVDQGWLLENRDAPLLIETSEMPRSQPPDQVSLSYRLSDGTRKRGNALQLGEAAFNYELAPLGESVDLYLTGGDDWLGPIPVEPIDRPTVAVLEITALRPGSSEAETVKVGASTEQQIYQRETKLELKLVASQSLQTAEALSDGRQLSGWERVDERTYTLRWTMQDPLALEFRLVGEQGGLASKPYFLSIGLLRDREPRLTLRSSGVGRRITPVARIPLAIHATDDFGIASLGLESERTQLLEEKPQTDLSKQDLALGQLAADAPPRIDVLLDHELKLADQQLAPGNLIRLRSTATDACALGAQQGYSRWLAFQIVSADELFYEILTRQREQRAKFKLALESAKQQSEALEAVALRDEAVAIARAQSVVNRQVWQTFKQLDASLQEMTLNELGNPAARELMQSGIVTPLETLHGGLLTRLSSAVGDLMAQESIAEESRAEAVRISQQAVQAMEAILAQMAQWESFVDVINQLKHVIESQGKVLEATEELDKQRTKDLFDD